MIFVLLEGSAGKDVRLEIYVKAETENKNKETRQKKMTAMIEYIFGSL
jgi:hypothetical protein